MSVKRKTTVDIASYKNISTPIVCLTAYSYPMAKKLDNYCDLLLVGDTVGMVLYGMDSTIPVTVDIMINHGKAVVKATEKSCIVVDMPFGSYESSKEEAFKNAARIIKETGCSAVKLEGGAEMKDTISFLVERGIPVVAHIGLKPQNVNITGGYVCHGKDDIQAESIINDALAVEEAGAFAVVIECTEKNLSDKITKKISIPTIGIGASPECDGQILVTEDMLGMIDGKAPKFVSKYANLSSNIEEAVSSYADDVRNRKFPAKDNCYYIKKQVSELLS